MPLTVAIHHKTTYEYDRPVTLTPHQFRLRPAPHCRTRVQSYSLNIEPSEHFINWQQDPFGNYVARVVFPERTRRLKFEVDIVVELVTINPFDFFVDDYAEAFPFEYESTLAKELSPYLEKSAAGPRLKEWLQQFPKEHERSVNFLFDLNSKLAQDIAYTIRMEAGVQEVEYTLEKRLGSCRDSAWVLVHALRELGLAARFVSGYLVQLKSDQKSLDGPSGPEEDFTDLHAWAEVFVPGAGWIGLDPTSGLFAGEGHLPLAATPHYSSAAPIIGASDKAEVTFSFENSVKRIHEDPRVTKPYTSLQWQNIDALGEKVEKQLVQDDVRLTMGGEPTFISIDDFESAQWNEEADGEHKRERAEVLFKKLQQHFAPGALRYYGQGKWYPGEPLPRWQKAFYWRRDGEAMWEDESLFADLDKDYGQTIAQCGEFTSALCEKLGLAAHFAIPAFEDNAYYLWAEGNLPENFDPEKANLKDGDERKKLLQVLQSDMGEARAFVLPLTWAATGHTWQTSAWQFKREQLFLIPGDSPAGLRLPLDRVHWQKEKKALEDQGRDPFAQGAPLAISLQQARERAQISSTQQVPGGDPQVLTALCLEIREGKIFLFLPPLPTIEAYLLLTSHIEAVAAKLKMPVVLEGYAPPHDDRVNKLAVTPDPGVIEVNIHPAESWQDLKDTMLSLYEHARSSRLDTVKYMIDGRQAGTGGGNHVTLGGKSPLDSPLLRKPSVLRSFITYWQHHPGLSYLFSSQFIGPTSQAPRVDESRTEFLYELETAFGQFRSDEEMQHQPWLVDRLLRHLLVDITGNTHRSEFCIDKMYSPDSPSGRLGILEFRAFEMPPHPQMALAQMLLLRTFLAHFWRKPYAHKLVRWGTDLYDRFLLPHYVWEDMRDVCNDLKQWGFDYDLEWMKPFWEFRFPILGRVQIRDINMEVRAAIEPWHVLGEEMHSGGTARFVDSSVERIQVKVNGLVEGRYIVSCNGVRAPLSPTGKHGEFVCGIRFRAWAPPSALHPTVGVQAPLVIDLVDTWSGKAVGGCTYHVAHPGGRSSDTFPVNGLEAEGRMLARFAPGGHSPGNIAPVMHSPVRHGTQAPATKIVGNVAFEARDGSDLNASNNSSRNSSDGSFDVPEAIIEDEFPHTLDLVRRQKPS